MNPLVSVVVVTYQHVNYIKDCLDGILMQETSFSFEIILGEDESTDGTREICIKYAEQFPQKIRLFLRSRKDVIYNDGKPTGRYNFIECTKAAKGEFIAICEGDDYWTDPLKLQKQVDFLQQNKLYSLVCHDYNIINTTTDNTIRPGIQDDLKNKYNDSYQIDLSNWTSPYLLKTHATLFRREWFDIKIAMKYKYFKDVFMFIVLLSKGPGKFINQKMSVYRISGSGIWSMKTQSDKALMVARIGYDMNAFFKGKNKHIYSYAKNGIESALAILNKDITYLNKKIVRELRIKFLLLTYKNNNFAQNYNLIKKIFVL